MKAALAVAVAAVVVLVACTPGSVLPSPSPATSSPEGGTSPSVGPVRTLPPDRQLQVPGELLAAELGFRPFRIATDGRIVVAVNVHEPGGPVRSEVFVVNLDETPARPQSLLTSDALIEHLAVAAGRVAYSEHREDPDGSWRMTTSLHDLSTGRVDTVWSGEFTPATFRGGGGGRVGPFHTFRLDDVRIAYVHLTERAGGELSGELRVREVATGAERSIAASERWIEPIGLRDGVLGYAVGGDILDEIHRVDLGTGEDHVIRRAPFIRSAAMDGRWLLYTTTPRDEQVGPYAVILRDLGTVTERTLDTFGSRVSLGDGYAVWESSSVRGPSEFRAAPLHEGTPVAILDEGGDIVSMAAFPGGVLAVEQGAERSWTVYLARTPPAGGSTGGAGISVESAHERIRAGTTFGPVLLPGWLPTVGIERADPGFLVGYINTIRQVRIMLAAMVPGSLKPLDRSLQRRQTFREDADALYLIDDQADPTSRRTLVWEEPALAGSSPEGHPPGCRCIFYVLTTDGVDEATFWRIAGSLESR